MTDPLRKNAMRFIVCLGIVSLFADMTYEGAYSIIGPYLKELGASAVAVGFVAGVGEMLAASLRYFTGKLADKTRAYWPITFMGYGLNLLVVPALAFVGSWQAAAILVAMERTGKAMRGPARDVLLSEATEVVGHGWGFGLHAAFDQTGAVLGPLLMVVAVAKAKHFGPAFLLLAFPAAATLLALVGARWARPNKGTPPAPKGNQELPNVYWRYVIGAGLLACGFIDFPILSFHFENTHLFKPEMIPLLYAGAMGATGLAALICGRLFDRYGIIVLTLGIIVSMATLPLGFLFGPAGGIASVICWGFGLGVQDATLRPGISQVVSMNKRGTAFGSFNGVYGVAWFLGSLAMGYLYDHSIMAVVVFGVLFHILAMGVFASLKRPLEAVKT